MRRCTGALLIAALSLVAETAAAQTPPRRDTMVHVLDELVVRTTRAAATTGGASALVARPDSLLVVPAPTLEAVLRQTPLVRVRRNSRGEAQVTVRGSSERQRWGRVG